MLLSAAFNRLQINSTVPQPEKLLSRDVPQQKKQKSQRQEGGRKTLKQSRCLKTERWTMKQVSHYPIDTEQGLSVIQRGKSAAPVKIINLILDWHNCVIWHRGLLPANHGRLLADFLFIHQRWIPKAMMQANTPRVCSSSGFISILKRWIQLQFISNQHSSLWAQGVSVTKSAHSARMLNASQNERGLCTFWWIFLY